VSDEKWGEAGMAFVCLKPGFALSEEELRAYCMGRLAKYKIPKYFRFLSNLPKNDAGKIDRKVLKTMH
jgi:fatty-acyl-CoA synthase